MVVKQATTLDLDVFYELFTVLMKEGYSSYSPQLINYFLTNDYSKEKFFLWLDRFFRIVYLAFEDDTLMGFLVGDYTYGGIGFISWIGVDPRFRNKGIGRRLYEAYENFAISKKAHLIELYTYPKVEQFYINLGFHRIGSREQGYFGNKNLIMNKKIGLWTDDNL